MVLLLGAEVLAAVRRSLAVVRILGSLQVVDSILRVVDALRGEVSGVALLLLAASGAGSLAPLQKLADRTAYVDRVHHSLDGTT